MREAKASRPPSHFTKIEGPVAPPRASVAITPKRQHHDHTLPISISEADNAEIQKAVLVTVVLLLFHGSAADNHDGGQLRQLRFSWDGKYVLVQDDSEITVLTASPFAVHFRIPVQNVTLAQFTPDSGQIAFVTSATIADPARIAISHESPRVERWSVPDGARIAPIGLPGWTCGSMALAPDLRTFVCDDFEGTLRVIELPTSETVLEVKKFVQPGFVWIGLYRYDHPSDLGNADLHFSPDGRVLVASGGGGPSDGSTIFWDVTNRCRVRAKGALRILHPGPAAFTFLTSDRMLIYCPWKWGKKYNARIVTVPNGVIVARVFLPPSGPMYRAADPAFLLLHQYGMTDFLHGTQRSAAIELATGQAIISEMPMLDVFGNHYITEVRPGVIGLYERGKGLQATVALHEK